MARTWLQMLLIVQSDCNLCGQFNPKVKSESCHYLKHTVHIIKLSPSTKTFSYASYYFSFLDDIMDACADRFIYLALWYAEM